MSRRQQKARAKMLGHAMEKAIERAIARRRDPRAFYEQRDAEWRAKNNPTPQVNP